MYFEIEEIYKKLPIKIIEFYLIKNHEAGFGIKDGKYFAIFCTKDEINYNKNKFKISAESKLFDALYIYELDICKSIEYFTNKNKNKNILNGSVYNKSERIFKIIEKILETKGAIYANKNIEIVKKLCFMFKLDCGSETVNEFPQLEGVITMELLKKSDLSKFLEDIFNKKLSFIESKLVYLADKIDNLTELWNKLPTGSEDPCGLKKDMRDIFNILIETNIDLNPEIFQKSENFFRKKYYDYLVKKNNQLQYLNEDLMDLKKYLHIDLNLHAIKRIKNLLKENFTIHTTLNAEEKLIEIKISNLNIENFNEICLDLTNYLDNNKIVPFIEKSHLLINFLTKTESFLKIKEIL